ncbi:hypothetical protein FI667_g6188, partial [Globisporangium splendens]
MDGTLRLWLLPAKIAKRNPHIVAQEEKTNGVRAPGELHGARREEGASGARDAREGRAPDAQLGRHHVHALPELRTVVLKDVLQALREMDFEHFIEPIEDCLRDAKINATLKKPKRSAEKPDAAAADAIEDAALEVANDDEDDEMQSAEDIATEEDDDDAAADDENGGEDGAEETEAADPQEASADAMEEDSAVDQTESANAPQCSD